MAASLPAKSGPLSGMTKLSPSVLIHQPSRSSATITSSTISSPQPPPPKLIIVASWMDARDIHIAKYIAKYQELYPTSSILLTKYTIKQVMISKAGRDAIKPAVSFLRSLVDSGYISSSDLTVPAGASGKKKPVPEVLIHIFSNGGMASMYHFYNLWLSQNPGSPFPLHATIFDSCPGLWDYGSMYRATMAGVPNKLLWRLVFTPLVHALVVWFWLLYIPWGRKYPLMQFAERHNDPVVAKETNRAYVYSKTDEMVKWNHVVEHAKQAEENGFRVRLEEFSGTRHVAHVRGDEGRYWGIVVETWQGERE